MTYRELDFEPKYLDSDLVKIIFGSSASIADDVTTRVLSGHEEGGWVRAGAEAFMQVKLIKLGKFNRSIIPVVMKSIISMGDMQYKLHTEANRLDALGTYFAPQVYAIGHVSLIREFLIEDSYRLKSDIKSKFVMELYERLNQLGLTVIGGIQGLPQHCIQSGGRIKLFDAGTGDISG